MKRYALALVAIGLLAGAYGDNGWAHGGHRGARASNSARAPAQPHAHHHRFRSRLFLVPVPLFFYTPVPRYYRAPAAGSYSQPANALSPQPGVRYYCPDLGAYYPDVIDCPSPWLNVSPGEGDPLH